MLLLRCICGGENAAEATGFLSFLHLALLTGGTNISRLYRSSRTQKRRISLAIMSTSCRAASVRMAAPPSQGVLRKRKPRLAALHRKSLGFARRCGLCRDNGHVPLELEQYSGSD